jgi:hypothetical protein
MPFPQTRPSFAQPPAGFPRWSLVTPGAALPVDLDTVKTFLNRPIQDTEWDAETTSFVKVAALAIESYAQLVLCASTWRGDLPAFYDNIRIAKRPFLDVTKIEYVDPGTGTITTVDPSLYHALPIVQNAGMAFLGDALRYPVAARRYDAVRITARAGFAITAADVAAGFEPMPDNVQHALLMTVASIDAKRGDEQSSGGGHQTVYAMKNTKAPSVIPPEAKALLGPWVYRNITI